jgi:hypothetical protein
MGSPLLWPERRGHPSEARAMTRKPASDIGLMARGPSFERAAWLGNMLRMADRKEIADPTDDDIQEMREAIPLFRPRAAATEQERLDEGSAARNRSLVRNLERPDRLGRARSGGDGRRQRRLLHVSDAHDRCERRMGPKCRSGSAQRTVFTRKMANGRSCTRTARCLSTWTVARKPVSTSSPEIVWPCRAPCPYWASTSLGHTRNCRLTTLSG